MNISRQSEYFDAAHKIITEEFVEYDEDMTDMIYQARAGADLEYKV